MSDHDLKSPHQRLKAARAAAGYATAADAARALGIRPPTYTHHENGTAGFSRHVAKYASRLHVSPEWLLTGRGEMRGRNPSIPIMGIVGAGSRIVPTPAEEQYAAVDDIDIPQGAHVGALLVRGESGWPRFQDGEVALYDMRPEQPRTLLNRYAVLDTVDGRRLLKLLRPGGRPNAWTLESHNAPPEEGVELLAAYRYLGLLSR